MLSSCSSSPASGCRPLGSGGTPTPSCCRGWWGPPSGWRGPTSGWKGGPPLGLAGPPCRRLSAWRTSSSNWGSQSVNNHWWREKKKGRKTALTTLISVFNGISRQKKKLFRQGVVRIALVPESKLTQAIIFFSFFYFFVFCLFYVIPVVSFAPAHGEHSKQRNICSNKEDEK